MLKRIEDFAQNVAPAWSNIRLVPRGVPRFPDQSFRGSMRFAKRRGNFLPVMTAENLVRLAQRAEQGSREIFVSHMFDDLEDFGNIISLGRIERQKVVDVDLDEGRLLLDEPLITNHDSGSEVVLYAVPIEVIGPVSAGNRTLQIRAGFPVLNGDRLSIRTVPEMIRSGIEYRIKQTRFLGTSGLLLNYEVDLEEGLPRNLTSGEEIEFRALPGYESPSIQIPHGANLIGPFLIDTFSGTLVPERDVELTLAIQLFDGRGDPLPGYEHPVTVSKNEPITKTTIDKQSLLLWDVIKGSIQYNGEKTLFVCDDEGEFALSTSTVPHLRAGSEWEIPVRASANALLRTKAEPNPYRDHSLPANVNRRPVIGTGEGEEEATRLEIVVRSQPGAVVEADNLHPHGSSAVSLRYTLSSNAEGDFRWQSTGLILKPYFLALHDIKARHDASSHNSGVILL